MINTITIIWVIVWSFTSFWIYSSHFQSFKFLDTFFSQKAPPPHKYLVSGWLCTLRDSNSWPPSWEFNCPYSLAIPSTFKYITFSWWNLPAVRPLGCGLVLGFEPGTLETLSCHQGSCSLGTGVYGQIKLLWTDPMETIHFKSFMI